ncbi:MAG: radical SAM family heme chaperone HemW [Flavobacteriaceae bacterium]
MGERSDRPEGGFGVYVHWPFCQSKCPYCDFNSHVRHAAVDQQRFAAAFAREIAWFAERSRGHEVESIFFGGGTPSLMRPETVGAIIDAVAASWPMAADPEITLEANPSSVEADRFAGYRAVGVNRVSIGVQALNDPDLRALGRLHDVAEARRAIATAERLFERFSFDLIYARPGQTRDAWERELAEAAGMAGGHLSLYQLTIEPETPFAALHAAGKLAVPDADAAAGLYETTQEIMDRAGMPAYEISNHARPGHESRHNLVYWRYGRYAGIGPGAHARLDGEDCVLGLSTERHPESWLQAVERDGCGIVETERLGPGEQGDELLLMGLRLAEGIDPERFRRIAGRPLDPAAIRDLEAYGMIETTPEGRLRATADGFAVLNAVIADLAAEPLLRRA